MSYTIVRSNGNTLTTIQDGTINTTSSSLSLPGRNYAGYGQTINTNLVRLSENFASASPPSNALKGQLWFNTTAGTMNVCPRDGESNALAWYTLAQTSGGGDTAFTNVDVSESINVRDVNANNSISLSGQLTVLSDVLAPSNINILEVDTLTVNQTAAVSSVSTQSITAGSTTNSGTLTGSWTVNGNSDTNGTALVINAGDIKFPVGGSGKILCDNYYYANGVVFNPAGQYSDSNVSTYLTGAGGHSQFTGNIAPTKVTTATLAAANNGLGAYVGTITGIWTLGAGSRLNATYADLAERFEADEVYEAGTVVEIGGEKEITAVETESSEEVFGVISVSGGYIMNGMAGDDDTHPTIAMSGRVPVKVIGKVKKGQRLISAGVKGYARAAKRDEMTAFNVIGRALENKTTSGTGTVLAVVAITK